MNPTLHQFLHQLAGKAAVAAASPGPGRAYRFSATATPRVVLALLEAVDAADQLCQTQPHSVCSAALRRVLEQALAPVAGGATECAL